MATWQDIQSTPRDNPWKNLYKQQNTGVGVAEQPQQANLMGRLNNFLGNTAKKLVGPVSSALGPAEVATDALIRKDPNRNFGQRLADATMRGSDIGGALQTRGIPSLPANIIGFAGSLALPGAGELGQAKNIVGSLDKLPPLERWAKAMVMKDSKNLGESQTAISKLYELAKDYLGPDKFSKMMKSKKWGENKMLDYIDKHLTEDFKFSEEVGGASGVIKKPFEIPYLLKKKRFN